MDDGLGTTPSVAALGEAAAASSARTTHCSSGVEELICAEMGLVTSGDGEVGNTPPVAALGESATASSV